MGVKVTADQRPTRKGIPNKPKQVLLRRLKDAYGEQFNPIMRMAENAVKTETVSQEMYERFMAAKRAVEDGNATDVDPQMYVAAAAHLGQALKNSIDAWDRVAKYTVPAIKAREVAPGEEDEVPEGQQLPHLIRLIGHVPEEAKDGK